MTDLSYCICHGPVTRSGCCEACEKPYYGKRITDLERQLQELEAGQQWVSVEDKPPPTYTEVWIRGEGFEVLATLEQSNDEPGEEEFDWYPCFFEVGEPLYPTEWRYVTPPTEDKSDE